MLCDPGIIVSIAAAEKTCSHLTVCSLPSAICFSESSVLFFLPSHNLVLQPDSPLFVKKEPAIGACTDY